MTRPRESAPYELGAMAKHLQDYLLGDRLFKTVTVHAPGGDYLIKMTLGAMLERLDEVRYHGAAPEIVAEATEALERARRSVPERFFGMLGREAKSYTDSWNWFLQNCWESEGRCQSDYPQEVAIRLRLERLLDFAGEHAALADTRQRLRSLDERLRAIWQESNNSVLYDGVDWDRSKYWWLYGQPQPESAG